jgi:hypothetical protein
MQISTVDLHPLNPSWNLEVLMFAEGGKTGEPREKPLKQDRANKHLYSHMTPSLEIEPGTTEVIERQALTSLRHPCFPIIIFVIIINIIIIKIITNNHHNHSHINHNFQQQQYHHH